MSLEVELYDAEKGTISGRLMIADVESIKHILEQEFGCSIYTGKIWFDTTMDYQMMKDIRDGKNFMVFNPFDYTCSSTDIHDIARILSETARKGGNPESN